MEFYMELRQSDRAYIVHTKGVSYALKCKTTLTIIYSPKITAA